MLNKVSIILAVMLSVVVANYAKYEEAQKINWFKDAFDEIYYGLNPHKVKTADI